MMNSEGTLLSEDRSLFTISNVLSAEECDHFIRFTEREGFSSAPITTSRGMVLMPEVRNNARCMLDDPALGAALFGRLRGWIPEGWESFRVLGLNERFRYYRYDVGEYFRWHHDGAFVRSRSERSLFTVMVYLNDDFEGGTTDFEGDLRIAPRRGMALLFEHHKRHQGAAVTRGRKYVLRTDVMYQRS
jgi:prolyl 4-hydroxylase